MIIDAAAIIFIDVSRCYSRAVILPIRTASLVCQPGLDSLVL